MADVTTKGSVVKLIGRIPAIPSNSEGKVVARKLYRSSRFPTTQANREGDIWVNFPVVTHGEFRDEKRERIISVPRKLLEFVRGPGVKLGRPDTGMSAQDLSDLGLDMSFLN